MGLKEIGAFFIKNNGRYFSNDRGNPGKKIRTDETGVIEEETWYVYHNEENNTVLFKSFNNHQYLRINDRGEVTGDGGENDLRSAWNIEEAGNDQYWLKNRATGQYLGASPFDGGRAKLESHQLGWEKLEIKPITNWDKSFGDKFLPVFRILGSIASGALATIASGGNVGVGIATAASVYASTESNNTAAIQVSGPLPGSEPKPPVPPKNPDDSSGSLKEKSQNPSQKESTSTDPNAPGNTIGMKLEVNDTGSQPNSTAQGQNSGSTTPPPPQPPKSHGKLPTSSPVQPSSSSPQSNGSESSPAQNPLASSSESTPNIKWQSIAEWEGVREKMYVPKDKTDKTKVSGHSGPTIGTGVDLGAWTYDDLKALGVDEALLNDFIPYFGKKGQDADDYVKAHPLNINSTQRQALDQAVQKHTLDGFIKLYNQSIDQSKQTFTQLPSEIQTVLYSVRHHYGPNIAKRCPNFWKFATEQNWDALINELRNFGDHHQDRRNQEANLVSSAIVKSALDETKATVPESSSQARSKTSDRSNRSHPNINKQQSVKSIDIELETHAETEEPDVKTNNMLPERKDVYTAKRTQNTVAKIERNGKIYKYKVDERPYDEIKVTQTTKSGWLNDRIKTVEEVKVLTSESEKYNDVFKSDYTPKDSTSTPPVTSKFQRTESTKGGVTTVISTNGSVTNTVIRSKGQTTMIKDNGKEQVTTIRKGETVTTIKDNGKEQVTTVKTGDTTTTTKVDREEKTITTVKEQEKPSMAADRTAGALGSGVASLLITAATTGEIKTEQIASTGVSMVKNYGIGHCINMAQQCSHSGQAVVGSSVGIGLLVAGGKVYDGMTSKDPNVSTTQLVGEGVVELIPTMLQVGKVVTKLPVLDQACKYATVTVDGVKSVGKYCNGDMSAGSVVENVTSSAVSMVASGATGAIVATTVLVGAPALAVTAGSAAIATVVGWGVSKLFSGITSIFKCDIIVIDNDPKNCTFIKTLLCDNGYNCDINTNHQQVLDSYESWSHYEVIFVYNRASFGDNLGLLRRLRNVESKTNRPKRTYIIYLDPQYLKQDTKDVFQNGADAHLRSEADKKEILDVVNRRPDKHRGKVSND